MEAWSQAHLAMILFEPVAHQYKGGENGKASDESLTELKLKLLTFYKEFRKQVMNQDITTSNYRYGTNTSNTYFSPTQCTYLIEKVNNPNNALEQFYFSGGARARIKSDSTKLYYDLLVRDYYWVLAKMDQYIAAELVKVGRKSDAEMLSEKTNRSRELERLLLQHPGAFKIKAVFYPYTIDNSEGAPKVTGIPIDLYAYKENNEWVLTELRSKQRPAVNTSEAGTEDFPPPTLFHQLNSKLRFPKGRLYWEIPGKDLYLSIPTTESLTMSEWLGYVGAGFAIAALVLSTGGLALPATIAIIASAGFSIASSVADIAEKKEQGILESKDVGLNVVNIVGSLATAGTASLGRIAATGAFRTGAAARLAVFADRAFIPLVITQVGADVVSLVSFSEEALDAYQKLSDLPSSPDKDLALQRFFIQSMLLGSITILGVKGDIKDIRGGRTLELDYDQATKQYYARPLIKESSSMNIKETGSFNNISTLKGVSKLQLSDFDPGDQTAFSGIYDTITDDFLIYPSGNTTYKGGVPIPSDLKVDRGGGHRQILQKYQQYTGIGENFQQLGFTVFYKKEGELFIDFFSRSVNGPFNRKYYNRVRPTGNDDLDFVAPVEYHDDVINSLFEIFKIKISK